jgi:hypothetical protein
VHITRYTENAVRYGEQRNPMIEILTAEGYEQTKDKLRDLERRLAAIGNRTDLDPGHLARVRRSYRMMMREFMKEIKLYEAKRSKQEPMAPE